MKNSNNLFRIHLFTEAGKEEYRKYCFENNLIAIGWPVDEKDYKNIEDYVSAGKEKRKKEEPDSKYYGKSFTTATNRMREMKTGDLCWTKMDNGKYYIGRVKDEEIICKKIPKYLNIGCYRKCEKWKEIEPDDVPGKVINCLIGHSTIQKIEDKDGSIFSYSNCLYEGKEMVIKDMNQFFFYFTC